MGKRVDYSGRTVISPDPNVEVDEIVIPEHVAKKITYPGRVTDRNIAELRKTIVNGVEKHPGAFMVEKVGAGNFPLVDSQSRRDFVNPCYNDLAATPATTTATRCNQIGRFKRIK
ncbi:unnamed protein product, partial [Amoebophrya sp. A25]|eukprot:GSA25T00022228001.1